MVTTAFAFEKCQGAGLLGFAINTTRVYVARAGAVTRVLPIEASYTIWFTIETQALCHRAGWAYDSRSTVAQLYLFGGGNTWYTVNRSGTGSLEVVENYSSDGLCTDSAGREIDCPVSRTVLGHIEVPATAAITERFLDVEREETGVGRGKIHESLIECPR